MNNLSDLLAFVAVLLGCVGVYTVALALQSEPHMIERWEPRRNRVAAVCAAGLLLAMCAACAVLSVLSNG